MDTSQKSATVWSPLNLPSTRSDQIDPGLPSMRRKSSRTWRDKAVLSQRFNEACQQRAGRRKKKAEDSRRWLRFSPLELSAHLLQADEKTTRVRATDTTATETSSAPPHFFLAIGIALIPPLLFFAPAPAELPPFGLYMNCSSLPCIVLACTGFLVAVRDLADAAAERARAADPAAAAALFRVEVAVVVAARLVGGKVSARK